MILSSVVVCVVQFSYDSPGFIKLEVVIFAFDITLDTESDCVKVNCN